MLRNGIILLVTCFLGLSPVLGRNALEVESRYTGDGWFEYRLRTLEDPFLKEITFYQLFPDSSQFTNYLDTVLPPHWTNYFYNGKWTGIMFDGLVPQPRINEISFAVRSSAAHFKRQAHTFRTIVNFQFTDPYHYGGSLGGYVNMECLVPCLPGEADGSPAILVARAELVRDVKIDDLIVTNGHVHGVIFSWVSPSTVQLEGSHDLDIWTPIARFFGDPPKTTWTTNASLNSYGRFFRISLIAGAHLTNALALPNLAVDIRTSQEIPITSQELIQDHIRIGFASVPNAIYEVEHYEWHGQIIDTQQVVASETCTTVSFDIGASHGPGSFKVRQLVE